MREEPTPYNRLNINNGITPACAGRTFTFRGFPPCLWDHPRVCGKNSYFRVWSRIHAGSPPRVREERSRGMKMDITFRITPACAGRTDKETFNVYHDQDHPRVCGKNRHGVHQSPRPSGSPPRVREEPGDFFKLLLRHRITPACAGRTFF